jgi:predicted Zn-dependent protease
MRENLITNLKTKNRRESMHIGDWLSQPLYQAYNWVYSKNPLLNQRQFHFIPLLLEKMAGSVYYVYYLDYKTGAITEKNLEYKEIVQRVQGIGSKLVKANGYQELDFEFKVINDGANDEAWCISGGKIGINIGFIQSLEKPNIQRENKNSTSHDDRIAAVLSREIVHAVARHTTYRLERKVIEIIALQAVKYILNIFFKAVLPSSRIQEELLSLIATIIDFSTVYFALFMNAAPNRKQELLADRYSMYVMKKAGYNPAAAVSLQKFFEANHSIASDSSHANYIYSYFRDYPSDEERLEITKKTLQEIEN